EGLVVAPAAQGVDQRPAGPAGEQDAGGGQGGEQEHGGARLVAVVQGEQGRHDEQGEQRGALEDGDDLLAEPGQPGDLVLTGDPEGAGGQQQDQGQLAQAEVERGRGLVDGQPAGLEADPPGAQPGPAGQGEVRDQEAEAHQLTAAVDHAGAPSL